MFSRTHEKTVNFFDKIRAYNSSLAFASFNANLYNFAQNRRGPYCLRIQGQIYYQVNTSSYPEPNSTPLYGQLFICDAQEALQARLDRNSFLDPELLASLDNLMRTNNVFAQSYMMMGKEISVQEDLNEGSTELQLLFSLRPGDDRRRYNFQRTSEVAAIFNTTADGEIPDSYVTIRHRNSRELKTLSSCNRDVEPWIYPLFYPFGTRGWHPAISRVSSNKRVSRAAYTKFHIAVRNEFNPILHGRRLFQQWLVDSYVKVEKDKLYFCKYNQKTLRADSYSTLR